MIDAGKLSEGQQMPTEEAIGALFSVSRITVRQALDGLAQAGYIYKVQGKGSFVASKKAGMQLNHLIGFSDEMRSLGLEPSTILMEQSLMLPTEAVAKALNIDVTQKIYFLTRIRCADGVPGINISLTSLWKSKLSLGLPRLRLGCAREKFFERYCYNNMTTCLVAA